MRTPWRDHSALHTAIQLAALIALAGCTGPLSTLDPSGPAAAAIARLWWVMLAGSAALFTLVMAVFALVFRSPGWGTSLSPYRWVVLGGLVLPGIVLLPLLAYGLIAGERLLPLPGSTPPRIEAHAERWSWTFSYPGHAGVATEGVVHLPAGIPVDVVVTSPDVIHAFWIPRLGGKIDVLPGHENVLRLQADAPGHYEGLCAEFCGVGHARMRFDVVVHPSAEYAAALANIGSTGGAKR